MIYFIQDETVCLIKIGYTSDDAANRLKFLQTGSPVGLRLLATIPGELSDERQLHARFAAHRERGEWFRPVPELVSLLIERSGVRGYLQGREAGRASAEDDFESRTRPILKCLLEAIRDGHRVECWDGELVISHPDGEFHHDSALDDNESLIKEFV
jgi:hypothetical protein